MEDVKSVQYLIFPLVTLTKTNFILLYRAKKLRFMKFSKKGNPNKHILTERLNDINESKKNLITLQSIMTIKNPMKSLTKTFTMAQVFYI